MKDAPAMIASAEPRKSHALLAPSSAERRLLCSGSLAMELREAEDCNKAMTHGTVAHHIAAVCLREGVDASAFHGRRFDVVNGELVLNASDPTPPKLRGWDVDVNHTHEVDGDMVECVQAYVDAIRNYSVGAELVLIEQSLPIGHITGDEKDAGTGDAIILKGGTLQVHDFKEGHLPVKVEGNVQELHYASGALRKLEMMDFDLPEKIVLYIHQPHVWRNGPTHWECTVEDVRKFEAEMASANRDVMIALEFADNLINGPDYSWLKAGEEQCHFCAAKTTCPKTTALVRDTAAVDFDVVVPEKKVITIDVGGSDDESLAKKRAYTDFIRAWCDAVDAECHRRAMNGAALPGWKLVTGREGNRAWNDPEAVGKLMKSFRLRNEEMYDQKLIGVPAAEKLLKKTSPKHWAKLEACITRPPGKPVLVADTDPRDAMAVAKPEDDFEVLAAEQPKAGIQSLEDLL
jgi:hypothetical protein